MERAVLEVSATGIFPVMGTRPVEKAYAFTAAKDFDARIGQSPWIIQFEGLEKTQFARFGIRRHHLFGLSGLVLLMVGTVAVMMGRRGQRHESASAYRYRCVGVLPRESRDLPKSTCIDANGLCEASSSP